MTSTDRLAEMAAEIERLRARIAELEGIIAVKTDAALRLVNEYAMAYGTLAPPPDPGDMPTVYSHDIPPSAPPHVGHTIKWPIRTGDDNE